MEGMRKGYEKDDILIEISQKTGEKTLKTMEIDIMIAFELRSVSFFPPTAECYGVSAQYRFRCVLGELGRFREKTGSGKVAGGFRESSGNRSGNRLGSRFQEPVPRFQGLDRFQGSRFQEPVPRLG